MLVAFSVTPIGTANAAVADEVAEAVRVVRASGLRNRTDAMFTTIEGEWDEVMSVIRRSVEAVAVKAPRVSVVIKIDHRPGAEGGLESKVASIEHRLR